MGSLDCLAWKAPAHYYAVLAQALPKACVQYVSAIQLTYQRDLVHSLHRLKQNRLVSCLRARTLTSGQSKRRKQTQRPRQGRQTRLGQRHSKRKGSSHKLRSSSSSSSREASNPMYSRGSKANRRNGRTRRAKERVRCSVHTITIPITDMVSLSLPLSPSGAHAHAHAHASDDGLRNSLSLFLPFQKHILHTLPSSQR